MLRMRRSRIILVLAVFTLFLLYHFKSIPDQWSPSYATTPKTGSGPAQEEQPVKPAAPPPPPGAAAEHSEQKPKEGAQDGAVANGGGLVLDTHKPAAPPQATKPAQQQAAPPAQTVAGTAAGGPANFGLTSTKTTTSTQIHWTKLPEHFPVPIESIIPLPTGKEKALPKIQHSFKDETPLERSEREKKLARITATFKKSWKGYTSFAWLHDELSPESGKFRDPFCGWAATLVDSLDSLLIMGLENEFQHALEGLAQIDFTTADRREIPLFETTIRYLGGLLSAYDLDGGKHKIILDKAVELAEVLMGSFDTPNRMPQTFYQWMPIFAEQPMRARTRVVMAELGSLSMEFTRLAQITSNNKYYDAIARIQNEFEAWQDNTKIPGLFPLYVDASGCKKPDMRHEMNWKQKLMSNNHDEYDARGAELINISATTTIVAGQPFARLGVPTATAEPQQEGFNPETNKGKIKNWGQPAVDKRQLDHVAAPPAPNGVVFEDGEEGKPLGTDMTVAAKGPIVADCVPQGLASPPGSSHEDFSFGGMADSTYEYMPKQYILLGGQVNQYKSMYEKSIAAANKYLLYRPMTPTEEDILILGNAKATEDVDGAGNLSLSPDLSHLLCFAGGMYGLGSKVFQRPEDLEIGKKMTDACVWAYGITTTGIMAEDFKLIKCDNIEHCPWNQTRWEDVMDPFPETRISDGLVMAHAGAEPASPAPAALPVAGAVHELGDAGKQHSPAKRQLGGVDNDVNYAGHADNRMHYMQNKVAQDGSKMNNVRGSSDSIQDFDKPLGHSEYVKFISELRMLPIGVPHIQSGKYILRPEAIESVFYMYRLTGDVTWREKGWRMYEAIEKSTAVQYGASAILDVMDPLDNTRKLDEMESFWLAETLKYFYLLFSTEDTISLDDYVMNTEAHPFKRTQPAHGA